jgi:hypothetical protein
VILPESCLVCGAAVITAYADEPAGSEAHRRSFDQEPGEPRVSIEVDEIGEVAGMALRAPVATLISGPRDASALEGYRRHRCPEDLSGRQLKALAWQTVRSSNLDSVAYCEQTADLYVTFKGGGVYRYRDVPSQDTMTSLVEARSPGSALAALVKPSFEYARIHVLTDGEYADE